MSDIKPISDGGPQDAAPSERPPSDQPPRDHVPAGQAPRDHVPTGPDAEPPSRYSRIGEHLTSRDSWLRLLFMLLFVAVWTISRLVVAAVVVLQAISLLLSGERNTRLTGFGASLAVYSYELVAYLTFASEKQPFPFSDWPDGSIEPGQADEE